MRKVKSKVLVIAVAFLAVAILATPVLAAPTNKKVPITIYWTQMGPPTPEPGFPKDTGIVRHGHATLTWGVEIEIDGVPTYTGTAFTHRYVVNVPQKDGNKISFREVYEMEINEADGGFVGSALILMDGIYGDSPKAKAHGLLQGYGDFEGQTINAGHHWVPMGPPMWEGYLLKEE